MIVRCEKRPNLNRKASLEHSSSLSLIRPLWQTPQMTFRYHYALTVAPLLLLTVLSACSEKVPEHTQLSERPPQATQVVASPHKSTSRLSTRMRISYADLAALVEEEVPTSHTDVGKQKVCKKILGMKACGNARWEYTVERDGNVDISGSDDYIEINVPMNFFGVAGIGGDVSKLLKLDKLKFNGAMLATLKLKLDLTDDWCPAITTDANYQWTKTPRLKWKGGLNLDMEEKVDDAIDEQLAGLQKRAENAIDCVQFRQSIEEHWTQHSIPLDLPNNDKMYLNIEPSGFSFSGIKTETDKLGLAFMLDAQTSLDGDALEPKPLTLPPLNRSEYETGTTEFNVLIRAAYTQLQSLAEKELVGKTFSQNNGAGEVSVAIDSLELAGNPAGITLNLGFRANLPGKSHEVPGNVYLTATPVLETFTQTVRLENISLSNVLDSTLWNTIAAVFNKKIIAELENKAVYELGPKLEEMSQLLETQLADPQRTGGLSIVEPNVKVVLEALVPEQDNLAAMLRVETQLDIDVPVRELY